MNIKKVLFFVGFLGYFLFFSPSSAFASNLISKANLQGYVGFDEQYRYLKMKTGYGDKIFEPHFNQLNVYTGLRFCDYFGVEVGYEWTGNKEHYRRVQRGDKFLGVNITNPGIDFMDFVSEIKLSGPHASLYAFYPVWECDNQMVELLASVGVVALKADVKLINIAIDGDAPPSDGELSDFTRLGKKTKNIFKLTAGLQYWANSCFAIRTFLGFEKTNTHEFAFNNTRENALSNNYHVCFKNTILVGLGIIMKIF